jgi:hypothetical protein
MKVYVVVTSVAYEGDELEAVYLSREKADAHALTITKDGPYGTGRVKEFEVIE